MGLISLTHRGAHATGLLFVSPLFAVFAPDTVFAAAALALPLVGVAGAAISLRAGEARAHATASNPSILSAAPAAAAAAPAGISPTSSEPDDLGAARLRLLLDARDDLVQRGGLPVLDVHADLDDAGARRSRPSARTPGKPPPVSRTTRRDLARRLEARRGG